jgi:hypothetical protein
MNTAGPITLGSTGINFVQISSAQIYSAGEGLQLDGVTFNVLVDGTSIEINGSNQLQLAAGGITGGMLANNTVTNSKLEHSTITISDGSASDDVSLGETLTFTSGAGTSVSVSENTVTIAGVNATDDVKGIASFDIADFVVVDGNVTLNVEGIQDIVAGFVVQGRAITITHDAGANTITFDADLATTSTVGVAKFNSTNFAVANTGDVTVAAIDGGTY